MAARGDIAAYQLYEAANVSRLNDAGLPEMIPAIKMKKLKVGVIGTGMRAASYLTEIPEDLIERVELQLATILWSRVICKEPGNYVAWPTIAKRNGELLVVFSGDREDVCPYGKTELIRSDDQGETWSEPRIINNTPLDDRDAGIVCERCGHTPLRQL